MMLRLANRADIPGMHRVRLAVRENRLSDPARITEADYIAAMEDLGRTWVIEAGGEVVAFASGYATGSVWALFVHPDHEGRGYGKALHATMIDWLWSLGHARLWLTTSPGRAPNVSTSHWAGNRAARYPAGKSDSNWLHPDTSLASAPRVSFRRS